MSASSGASEPPSYFAQFRALLWCSATELVRPASGALRAEAARRWRQQTLSLLVIGGIAVVGLMFAFDATEIGLMPSRGAPMLWPFRILTDFGNDAYVLWLLAVTLLGIA